MISTICKLSLTVPVVIPIALFAQNVAPANPATSQVAAPGTNIYVVGGGLYGTGVYVTPTASFASPAPTTGLSLAGRTGISLNEPVYTGVQSTLQPTPLNYYYGSPLNYETAPEYAGETVAESGPLIRDMLPSYSSERIAAQTPSMSVAEVAAQYKAKGPQNVRTFSNPDAQRLANSVTIAGTRVTGTAQPAAPPTPPATAPEPPAPETQTMAGNPTPPVAVEQPSQPATPSTAPNRLPATATLLPILGLAGLLSGGIGLWLRGKISR